MGMVVSLLLMSSNAKLPGPQDVVLPHETALTYHKIGLL